MGERARERCPPAARGLPPRQSPPPARHAPSRCPRAPGPSGPQSGGGTGGCAAAPLLLRSQVSLTSGRAPGTQDSADLVYSRLLRDRPLSSANFPTHTGSRAPGKNKFRSSNTTTSHWTNSTGQPRSLRTTCLSSPPRLFQNLPPHQLSAWGGLWGPRPTCTCSGGSWDTGPAYPPPVWGNSVPGAPQRLYFPTCSGGVLSGK